ncbi:MAG: archaeal proteasome endopeptidase complex subunit alpha [Promethearchaeota archaeon]
MFGRGGVGYDRSLTMFSPEGRLYQVEYALESVKKGTLAIGIKSSKGAVLVVHKKLMNSLMDPDSIQKIYQVDEHIGCAISGLNADSRILVEYARVQCQVNLLSYDEPILLRSLVRKIADVKQQYTQYGGARPFGSALMFISVDAEGPQLMTTAPTGRYWSWKATAIGLNEDQAKKMLEEKYKEDMTIEELQILGIDIIKSNSDEEITPEKIQIGYIDINEKKFKILNAESTKKIFDKIK